MPADRSLREANTRLALAIQERDVEKVRGFVEAIMASWVTAIQIGERQDLLQFATIAGRWALQRNEASLFAEIAARTGRWTSVDAGSVDEILPVLDAWLHRIVRHDRVEAVTPLFGALLAACGGTQLPENLLKRFVPDWRAAAGQACLNPESQMATVLIDGLAQLAVGFEKQGIWLLVLEAVSQVGALAVQRHGMGEGFSVIRPMVEQGRRLLVEEMKFGDGPDPDSLRQAVLRRICRQTLHVAEIAARGDVTATAGDMIVILYQAWMTDPEMASYEKSAKKFCQLLLLYWANNRKRTSRRWEPRDAELRVPFLFSEEEQAKLTFMID